MYFVSTVMSYSDLAWICNGEYIKQIQKDTEI